MMRFIGMDAFSLPLHLAIPPGEAFAAVECLFTNAVCSAGLSTHNFHIFMDYFCFFSFFFCFVERKFHLNKYSQALIKIGVLQAFLSLSRSLALFV